MDSSSISKNSKSGPERSPIAPSESSALRRSFDLLCWEAAFAFAFEIWVGPTYLTGIAGELGVPLWIVTLLSAAAFIGSVGQVLGLWFLARVDSLKDYTLRVAWAARLLWLIPLFLAGYWFSHQRSGAGAFPVKAWFVATASVACLSALLATSSAAAWQSWILALIPARFQGRFFGSRQRMVMAALIGANFLAAALIDWRPRGIYAGAWLLGLIAIIAASLSTWLLSRVSGVQDENSVRDPAPKPLKQELRDVLGDRDFRPILFFGTAFNFALLLAGNYFPYYFTREVGLPMSQVAVWFLLSNLGCLFASGFWGRRIDLTGDPVGTLKITTVFVIASPLPYVIHSAKVLSYIGPVEYFINGCAAAGYQLAMTALLFRAVPRERNLAYFSVYTAFTGLAGAVGSVVGGALAARLGAIGGFRALWVIASLARGAVVLAAFAYGIGPARGCGRRTSA